ncbi:MAG: redoxin domain-containing protein, partial [Methyloligellaceae bacterium]
MAMAALCLGALCMVPHAVADPVIGKPAPVFTGTDSNGKKVSLQDFRGKTVILEWTNHDCPFVRKHYGSGNMQALQKKATGGDVVWLSVISSAPGRQGHVSPVRANELTTARKASPSAVLLDPDGTIGRAYEATATPHMFVIDTQGTLVYKGAIDDKPSANPA